MWVWLLLYCLTPSLVVSQYSWEQYRSEGLSVRQGHSSVGWGDSIITYGGYNNVENEVLSDLLSYDLEEQRWSTVSSTGGPTEGRYGHTASLLHDHMVIVGGENTTSFLGDVWALDLGTFSVAAGKTDSDLLRLLQFPLSGKDCRICPYRGQDTAQLSRRTTSCTSSAGWRVHSICKNMKMVYLPQTG